MAVIPKILVFAGSLRSGAFSGRTADVAQKELAMQGAEVTRISLADYPLPILDEDLEKEKESATFCSFCGKGDGEVGSMITGKEGVFIGNECVELAVDIINNAEKR